MEIEDTTETLEALADISILGDLDYEVWITIQDAMLRAWAAQVDRELLSYTPYLMQKNFPSPTVLWDETNDEEKYQEEEESRSFSGGS